MPDIDQKRRDIQGVRASVNFHGDTEGKPYFYTFEPPAGVPVVRSQRESHTLHVQNGWRLRDCALDVHGFQAARCPTSFSRWDDPGSVAREYYPEVESYVLAVTKADQVVVFDHNVRSNAKAAQNTWANTTDYSRTADWVHNDYTLTSAPVRASEILGTDPGGRYAYVNLWRPIVEPLRDRPLAICDGRTIASDDLAPTALLYPDREGEYYLVRHNNAQRWYFFPEMCRDEALFLKCMDSAVDGRTRFSAHAAFHDPSAPPGAPPRESIEARTLVLWNG